jgi:flagellar operon protein
MSIADLYRTMGPIGPVEPRIGNAPEPLPKPGEVSDFEKVLLRHNELPAKPEAPADSGIKFSNHAETRIRSRAIDWNADLEKRVSGGIDSAREKGSRETLILAGNVAVIANVKSRTVITAMDAANLKERIFTNIDSAVIV